MKYPQYHDTGVLEQRTMVGKLFDHSSISSNMSAMNLQYEINTKTDI